MNMPKLLPDNRKNLTIWGNPETPLQSQYGTIPYGEWCRKEVQRINARTKTVEIVEADGMIAVKKI